MGAGIKEIYKEKFYLKGVLHAEKRGRNHKGIQKKIKRPY